MIPDNSLSSSPVYGVIQGGRALTESVTEDYETGGVALNDPSEGLQVKVWRARIVNQSSIVVDADGITPFIVVTGSSITEVSISFDSNMQIVVAYTDNNVAKLYWYDTLTAGYVTTEYPGAKNPRVSLDDKRDVQSDNRDVIFAYIRSGGLYFRMQRDRYEVEYLLNSSVTGLFLKFGMNNKLRLQFEFRTPATEPKIMLDESGNTRTWDMNQNWRSFGKQGEYDKRVIWRRRGQHRSYTPRVAISAPVRRAIFAAYVEIEPMDT